MGTKISRRGFLKALAAATGGVSLLALAKLLEKPLGDALAQNQTNQYIPIVMGQKSPSITPTPTKTSTKIPTKTSTKTPTRTATQGGSPASTATQNKTPTLNANGPKVVHVHNANATSWNFSSGWYGNYVDQNTVNSMVDEGLKQLSGQSTAAGAWNVLLPGYSAGKGIAIKVSFNNSSCSDSDKEIDALVEVVNGLASGMLSMGVRASDIWVYEASRAIPQRFSNRLISGVQFLDRVCNGLAKFSKNVQVTFKKSEIKPRPITDVIVDATYLINMPIIKDHLMAGVSLGFKNHFGTIYEVESPTPGLHNYIQPDLPSYSSGYNPMVDIYQNPNIKDKTVLTVGDGLFGALGANNVPPSRWSTFGNDALNSLFFATDPVAIDCVMMDVLYNEPVYHPQQQGADDYLKLADTAGLGVYERGDPSGSGYHNINYLWINQ